MIRPSAMRPSTVIALIAIAIGTTSGASPMDVFMKIPDIDGEAASKANTELERANYELLQVLQQPGNLRPKAARVIRLCDQIMVESSRLGKMYKDAGLKDGSKYVRRIGSEARRIRGFAKELGPFATDQEEQDFYVRVSQRLRHKERAQVEYDRWLGSLNATTLGKRGTPDPAD